MRYLAAGIQMSCVPGDVKQNLEKARGFIESAGRQAARLIVLPELFNTGYRLDEDYYRFAEPIPGPTTDLMQEMAGRSGAYIVGSIVEEGPMRGVPFNTSVIVGPDGVVGKQSKIMPWDKEKLYFATGETAAPFATGLGCLGLMICRDIRFGEIARCLAVKGAEILVVSSAAGGIDYVTQTRALDNSCYLVLANRVGQDKDTKFCGRSRIIDPAGKILAEADGPDEAVVTAEIDTGLIADVRNKKRYLQEWRASLFLSEKFWK